MKFRYEPVRFHRLANALGFMERFEKPQRMILGDDGLFWIVCPADAEKLVRVGYEYAR